MFLDPFVLSVYYCKSGSFGHGHSFSSVWCLRYKNKFFAGSKTNDRIHDVQWLVSATTKW